MTVSWGEMMSLGCQGTCRCPAGNWVWGSGILAAPSTNSIPNQPSPIASTAATPSNHHNILSGLALQSSSCLMCWPCFSSSLSLQAESSCWKHIRTRHASPQSLLMNSVALRIHTTTYNGLRPYATWPRYPEPHCRLPQWPCSHHMGSLTIPGTHQEYSLPQAFEPDALPHGFLSRRLPHLLQVFTQLPLLCEAFLLTPFKMTPHSFFPFFISSSAPTTINHTINVTYLSYFMSVSLIRM